MSVVTNDTISFCSPIGGVDGRCERVGRPTKKLISCVNPGTSCVNPGISTKGCSKPGKNPNIEGTNMMSGCVKANNAMTQFQSDPSIGRESPPPRPAAPDVDNASTIDPDTPGPSHTRQLSPVMPGKFRPRYHIARPTRKLQDWTIRAHKQVLVLGDSNINRIPAHNNPNVQLDSYPGANLYHFLKLLEKTKPIPLAKIVVLSIGLNNKDQDPKQTSCKQLKALYKQATVTFPNADIYFPVINFSDRLTEQQKSNLKMINNTIVTHFPCLFEIPHDTFATEKDQIHWTPTTASLIFRNWAEQLNLQ